MVTTHITRRLNSVAGKSFSPLGGGAGERRPSCSHYPKPRGMSFNPLGGGAGAWDDPTIRQLRRREESFQSPRRWGGVGLASTIFNTSRIISPSFNPLGGGAGSGSQHMQKAMEQISASGFQSPRRWGGVGLRGRCNDWPDMSLGSGFPYPPENGTKLGSLSLAPGSPGKRKRREQNRLRQVVTGARNPVKQGYEIRQSKKRRARPPRSGTGTRPGARRKPETRRGPVHSPRNGARLAVSASL
jgi:hypothetical protein